MEKERKTIMEMKRMKQGMIFLMLFTLTVSCTKSSEQPTGDAGSTPQAGIGKNSTESNQDNEVDGTSGATYVANAPSFNGIILMPPQSHVTLTLSMGGSIQDIHVLPGEYVRKGQTILTLANPAFIELQQSYLEAAAQSEYLEKEYTRQQNLASSESASQKRMQQSKAEYLSMKSRMEAAAAQLRMLGVDTKTLSDQGIQTYLRVQAPRNGYITNMNANVGKYFAAGEPVCDVVDKSESMIQLTAYEKDLDKLLPGSQFAFKVNGMSDSTFNATLVTVDQMVDNASRSIKVYARIKQNNPRFRPGMYVTAKITDKKQ